MKRIPLSLGLFAFVDDSDYDDLNQFKWQTLALFSMNGLKQGDT